MSREQLQYYIRKFEKLKRAHNNGGAPHKPILLLSVIDSVDRGYTVGNRVYLTPELLSLFRTGATTNRESYQRSYFLGAND